MDEADEADEDSSVIGTLHMEVTDEDWDPLQYARIGRPKSPPPSVRPSRRASPRPQADPEKLAPRAEVEGTKLGTWHRKRRRRRKSLRAPEEVQEATEKPEVPRPPSPVAPLAMRPPGRTYARRSQAPRLVAPPCGAPGEAGEGPTLEASEDRHSLAFCFPPPGTFDFEAEQALVQLSLNAETAKEQALQRTRYRRAYRYRLTHPTPDATQCEHCGDFYNTRPNFHMYSCPALHRKVPCPDCGRVFATSRTLRSHQVIHTRAVMKTHPCLLCGKLYASKKGVSRHMSDMHQDVMKHRHQCTVCHRRFSEESGLLKHVKVHEGREPLRCPGCDKHFTYPSNMKYHKCHGRPS